MKNKTLKYCYSLIRQLNLCILLFSIVISSVFLPLKFVYNAEVQDIGGHVLLKQSIQEENKNEVFDLEYISISTSGLFNHALIPNESKEENEKEEKLVNDTWYLVKYNNNSTENNLYKTLYNERLRVQNSLKKQPLYLLFHSWKSHLV